MKTKQAKNIIKCPYCGYEYLPGELFVPNAFLGLPYYVIRDKNNKILSYYGNDMDTNEEYICNGCNKKFTISTDIKFNVNEKKDEFDEEYKTKIVKPTLSLSEE